MPDDNPLDPNLQEKPAASDTPTGLSIADATNLIQEAVAPLADTVQTLAQNQATLNQQLGQMTQTLGSAPRQHESPVEETDFLTELTSGNAEAAIGKVVQNQMKPFLGMIGGLVQSGSTAFVDLEAQRVDQTFGTGAWDTYFRAPMDSILGDLANREPSALGDRTRISKEVNGLKGVLLEKLVDFRDKHKSDTETAELAKVGTLAEHLKESIMPDVINRTNGMGGIRTLEPGGVEVTEEVKQYLAERDRNRGTQTDPKDWIKATDYGNDINSYLQHKEKLANSNGADQ